MLSLRQAEQLNPLFAGSLLAEAIPSMRRHLVGSAKLHCRNTHYLLHGDDGRQQVWSTAMRSPLRGAPSSKAGSNEDGPCIAVVCATGCDWEKELRELQGVPALTGGVVVMHGKRWLVDGLTPCCDKQKCFCNGVPRVKLTNGSSTMTALLPVVRACIAGIR